MLRDTRGMNGSDRKFAIEFQTNLRKNHETRAEHETGKTTPSVDFRKEKVVTQI